jgi:hypothetical protein
MNSKPLPKIQSFLKELKRNQPAGKKQTLQEWSMAGGGVPTQYKGREHVWHAKVNKFAAGGEVKMAGGGDPRGEMKAYDPTIRERMADALQRGIEGLGGNRYKARQNAQTLMGGPSSNLPINLGIADVVPFLGTALGVDEGARDLGYAYDAVKRGDYVDAAANTVGAAAGLIPGAAGTIKGAKAVGRGALDLAKSDAAYNLSQKALASPALAAVRPMNVVKPTGGNFLTGRTEKDLTPLKTRTIAGETPAQRIPKHEELLKDPSLNQDQLDRVRYQLDVAKGEAALDKWVDSNLTNYVKKQMGTPDDPVRKLAEQGITHKPGLVDEYDFNSYDPVMWEQRKLAGFPEEGIGQSPMARTWEQASDASIISHRAGDIQEMPEKFAKREAAKNKLFSEQDDINKKYMQKLENAGFNSEERNLIFHTTTLAEKAQAIKGKNYLSMSDEVRSLSVPKMTEYMELSRENPWISKLDPETQLYETGTYDLGFDHIMDVLREDVTAGRIRPDQLNKVSMEQAVRRTYEYDQELAAKMNASRAAAREGLPTYKEYPEGYKWIELNKPGAFAQESEAMGHSVRGYEPPKGHPDWSEGSGDAGSSGYGHGGWEAIKSGKAKVYSLVDSKGAPHATVEVKTKGVLTDNDFGANDARIVEGRGDFGERGYRTTDNQFFETYADAVSHEKAIQKPTPKELEEPPSITQIKGKQNRAPNEEYLPYIQDFVRGGKWSDVGDIQNTGMRATSSVFSDAELRMLRERGETDIPHILSGEDIQRLHNIIVPEGKRLKYDAKGNIIGSDEGFAHGGAVHMAGGGAIKAALAKLGKFATESDLKAIKEAGQAAHEQDAFIRAAKNAEIEEKLKSMPARSKAANIEMGMYHPVGGGAKLSKPFEAMHSTRVKNPVVNTPKIKILTPEDLYREKAAFYPLVGDKADTGTFLTHIGEKELEVPVGLGGGPRYMDVNYNPQNRAQSSAWESGTGRTTALGNQAQRAGESGNPVFGVYTSGSGTNTDFNVMGTNAVLQQLPQSKFTKKTEKAFDAEMKSIYPKWPGVRSENATDLLMDKSQGELRKSFLTLMGSEPYQKAGLPDIPATRKAIMDPQLYNTPTNESGFRIARMDPTGRIVENPLHPSDYPTAMAGELEGQLNMGMDYKDMFNTHFANRRLLSQPESGDYYSFSRAHPIQYADQEWLDKIMKAQEAKNKLIKTGKYAKGGKVKPKGGLSAATKSFSNND